MIEKARYRWKSHHFLFILATISIITIAVGVIAINNNPDYAVTILGITATILGIIITIIIPLVTWLSQKKKNAQEILNIDNLLYSMIEEMKRIANNDGGARDEHLYILSYTPAFGNISSPKLYEEYRKLLFDIVLKQKADVHIICYDKNKRNEYHESMAKNLANNASEKKGEIAFWESQAVEIINLVRNNINNNAVVETGHIHPVLFFSSNNKLIQYTLRKGEKGSDVLGTVFQQSARKDFFSDAFREYKEHYTSTDITRIYEKYFHGKYDNKYINEAYRQKDLMRGRLAENGNKGLNVLLAYGGGKDSTMALIFLRYVQELFNAESKIPLILHIIVHLHPGMRKGVFQNIHNVVKKLGLNKDENIIITFKSKDHEYSKSELDSFFNETYKISIPAPIKNEFKRELLVLGHLSKGLGRHTFCYSCNIDMIMTIINYAIEPSHKIDFVVTGDSKKEKADYTQWVNNVFNFVNSSKGIRQNRNNNAKKTFIDNFIELQKKFNHDYFGSESQKNKQNYTNYRYPDLLNVCERIDFPVETFRELLDGLGFNFHDDAFNFSETDCFYPALMAHWAGKKGGANYNEYLRVHIEHVKEKMDDKGFPIDLINHAYNTFKNDDKVKEGYLFLDETFGIKNAHIRALLYSPFLDNGKRLQSFLNDQTNNIKGFNDLDVINYIQKGITSTPEIKLLIDNFITTWIGLEHKDIITIMNYSETPNTKDNLLEVIAQSDPYVKKVEIDGEQVIISGR